MNLLHRLSILFLICISSVCFANEETLLTDENSIKELRIEELNFAHLSPESKIGNLAECVQEQDSLTDSLLAGIRTYLIFQPFMQGLAYVNGVLCYVAHYPQSVIYTVLEGPQYGLQTVLSPQGFLLYLNYDYVLEYTPMGLVLHHYYSDSEVVTGSDQIIVFY